MVAWSDGKMANKVLSNQTIKYLEVNEVKEKFYYSLQYGKVYDRQKMLKVIGYEDEIQLDDS